MDFSKFVSMKVIYSISLALVILGGLNWFSIGFFNKNVLADSLENDPEKTKIVYGAYGIAAIILVIRELLKLSKLVM